MSDENLSEEQNMNIALFMEVSGENRHIIFYHFI